MTCFVLLLVELAVVLAAVRLGREGRLRRKLALSMFALPWAIHGAAALAGMTPQGRQFMAVVVFGIPIAILAGMLRIGEWAPPAQRGGPRAPPDPADHVFSEATRGAAAFGVAGSVLAAVLALFLLPGASPPPAPASAPGQSVVASTIAR